MLNEKSKAQKGKYMIPLNIKNNQIYRAKK